jgi:hypothetical protein
MTYHDYPAALSDAHVRLNDIIGCERFIGGYAPYIKRLRPCNELASNTMNKPLPAAPALSIPRQRPQPVLPTLSARNCRMGAPASIAWCWR